MTQPKFNLDKIKYATDTSTFQRAVKLYQDHKVKDFRDTGFSYLATVQGTQPYDVVVSVSDYDRGQCDCYLGQKDVLCKHMVAVAIYALKRGKSLSGQEAESIEGIQCSEKLGELSKQEIREIRQLITAAMRYIKSYRGPSRTWFAYQNSLDEGCNRLRPILSSLPVSQQTARFVATTLLRLDKRLTTGGVDDSNGTVGGLIQEGVDLLKVFVRLDPQCIKAFKILENQETCFGWEEELLLLREKTVSQTRLDSLQ